MHLLYECLADTWLILLVFGVICSYEYYSRWCDKRKRETRKTVINFVESSNLIVIEKIEMIELRDKTIIIYCGERKFEAVRDSREEAMELYESLRISIGEHWQ